MISPGELAVRLAAALLPRASRDRYREQWLGELRDAPEAGIRTSDIALGSLAFAATLSRPLPSGRRSTPDEVRRRSRLAAGLALGAALVALTRYADTVSSAGLTGMMAYDYSLFAGSGMLVIYGVLAPVFSVSLITLTKGASGRIRTATWLFAAACLAPVAQELIDSRAVTYNVFLSPGAAVYLVAVAAVIAGGALLRLELRSSVPPVSRGPGARTRVMSALAGAMVLVLAAVCVSDAVAVWAARTPLIFGGEIDSALHVEWMMLKAHGESLVSSVFFAWSAVCAAAGCAVAVGGLRRRSTARGVVVRLAVAIPVVTVTYAAVLDFLYQMTSSAESAVPAEPLMLLSRWFIIGVALATVGGVRFRRRADPRVGQSLVHMPSTVPAYESKAASVSNLASGYSRTIQSD